MEFNWGEVKGVIIATPFYEVKAYSPYVTSLVYTINALNFFKIPWKFYELSGDSYVDRAKNTLVHNFLKEEKYSHIFMIDSDEAWDVKGFMKIIKAAKYGAEIIGAAYPCKNNWEFYGCIPKVENGKLMGKEFDVKGGMRLLDMFCIPGGFICYSRKAIERTRPKLNSYLNPESNEMILECFRCNIEENGGRIGEDIYFQQRYKEMGGTIWLEPDVHIKHYGVKAWDGNYQNFLLNQKESDFQQIAKDYIENNSNI